MSTSVRSLFVLVCACFALGLGTMQANAAGTGLLGADKQKAPVAISHAAKGISTFAARFGSKPITVRFSPRPSSGGGLVTQVQGRACSSCRQICVEDFREDCDESERWCRRQFVRCMRVCWEDFCR